MTKKISDDDRDAFRAAMKNVKPLARKNSRAPEHVRARPPRRTAQAEAIHTPIFEVDQVAPVGAEAVLEFARNGISRDRLRDLRRGTVRADATLDLHGYTAANAQVALAHFLARCHANNTRCARIIHGKGRGHADTPSVLKSVVNRWLREQPAVLAFCSAPLNDGGTGALYVLLKRAPESNS